MSYDAEKVRIGREPFVFTVIEADICTNVFGVYPCTAAPNAGFECYNNRANCLDTANYNGSSLDLDGLTDHIVVSAPVAALSSTNISYEAWFYVNQHKNDNTIISNNKGNNGGAALYCNASGQVTFAISSASGQNIAQQPDTITERNWHHAVATYEGTSMKLFIDGVFKVVTSTPVAQSLTTDQNLYFGAASALASSCLYGKIDRIRVHSSALSSATINDHYINGAYAAETNITGYWPTYPDAAANALIDKSGNNNNGVIKGAIWLFSKPKSYKYSEMRSNVPQGQDMIPCMTKAPTFTPTRIDPSRGLGMRGAVTISLQDFPHHDRGIDPYVATRTYDPMTQGTYFGRWLARNKFYEGRTMRVFSGYLGDEFDIENFEERVFLIDSITDQNTKGSLSFHGKDILKLADKDRSKVPYPSLGVLTSAITQGQTIHLEVGATAITEYEASGYVRIGDEIIHYASANALNGTLVDLARGEWGSLAETHDTDDSVQQCKVYASVNVVDVIYDLLVSHAKVPREYIKYDNGRTGINLEWDNEKYEWLSANKITTILHEPEGVSILLNEILEQNMIDLWWDERKKVVRIQALSPARYVPFTVLNEDSHILADSIKVKRNDEERVSQIWIFYNQKNYTENLDNITNYKKTYIIGDLDKESKDQYGKPRIRIMYSRWFDEKNTGVVAQTASRLLAKFNETPRIVQFDLDAKDSHIWSGDTVRLITGLVQAANGSTITQKAQIIEAKEKKASHLFSYQALTIDFNDRRYAFVTETGTPDYASATVSTQERGCFVAASANYTFPDGTKPYLIS